MYNRDKLQRVCSKIKTIHNLLKAINKYKNQLAALNKMQYLRKPQATWQICNLSNNEHIGLFINYVI